MYCPIFATTILVEDSCRRDHDHRAGDRRERGRDAERSERCVHVRVVGDRQLPAQSSLWNSEINIRKP